MNRLRAGTLGAVVAALAVTPVTAQVKPPPGRPYLFTLDLQGTALDEFPSGVKALTGVMTVVDKEGQHMLKASSPSEFLITLPQLLPAEFTIELDFIPKACCAPDDIMLEGTPTMNRGPASAQLTWQPARISAVGGSPDMYQSAMPEDLAASTPGNLTHVVVVVQGTTIKLYTNGRRLYTLDKQFARGRVLRVWLGGADDGQNAVYLAGLRIGLGTPTNATLAGNTPGTSDNPAGGGAPNQPSELKGPGLPVVTPGSAPTPPPGPDPTPGSSTSTWPVTATPMLPWGVTIKWGPSTGAAAYRWLQREGNQPLQPMYNTNALPTGGSLSREAIRPGVQYGFQIQALDAAGAVLATSAEATYTAPADWPRITDLSSTVGGVWEMTQSDGTVDRSRRTLTLSWTLTPGTSYAWMTLDLLVSDPATGAMSIQHVIESPVVERPGAGFPVKMGATARVCLASLIDPFTVTGPLRTLAGATCLDTPVPFLTSTEAATTLPPRTIVLSGFSASGPTTGSLASRVIDLAGFSGSGGSTSLAPRTISLGGFTAAGASTTLPSRTITLGGWTAVGVKP